MRPRPSNTLCLKAKSAARDVAVLLNEAALTALLNSVEGPVGLDTRRRAEAVAVVARANASGGVVQQRTGNLAHSVFAEVNPGPIGVVGSQLPYGRFLEEGVAQGQFIFPIHGDFLVSEDNNPNPLRGPKRAVPWPGFEKKPWLTGALHEVFRA